MKPLTFRTRISDNLEPFKKILCCDHRKYCSCTQEVNSLLLLCQIAVDAQSEPFFWNLSVEEVVKLVSEKWNYYNLTETFTKNHINGKALILLEADRLPKMNIKQFDVIKDLTAHIREFCMIEKENPNRGISLPCRYPYTLYLIYKALRTGPTSYYMTPTNYMKKINIIRDETTRDMRYYALLNHWNRIPPYRPWCPHVLIGGIRRVNPMTGTTQRQILHPGKCKCKKSL